jgi:geranylgeranyl diphosphate synthase type I
MSSLAQPRARAKAALELFGREFVLVGLGQMKDLYAGASPESPAPRDVLDLYKLKTARYSFSLPLKLGCLLAGGKSLLGRKLEEVGEVFGLIFQLRDDDLGLFGNRAELGKPIGSDIKQGKKTLISILLRERAPARDAAKLSGIFGNPDASEGDIVFVRRLAEDLGVRSSVFQKIERYRRRAERLTKSLPADPKHIEILLDLLDFSLSRKK